MPFALREDDRRNHLRMVRAKAQEAIRRGDSYGELDPRRRVPLLRVARFRQRRQEARRRSKIPLRRMRQKVQPDVRDGV